MADDETCGLKMMQVEELKLLLEEKRTVLSTMRIGLATMLAQLAIVGMLIVTSKFYQDLKVLHLVIPFYVINLMLFGFSAYLVGHSLARVGKLDRTIAVLKSRYGNIMDRQTDSEEKLRR